MKLTLSYFASKEVIENIFIIGVGNLKYIYVL